MPQTATIKSLPAACWMMKAMQAEDVEWCENNRGAARQALAELLEGWMAETSDRHLERTAEVGEADRRNGAYARWLLAELGMIELHVPRTRTFSAVKGSPGVRQAIQGPRPDDPRPLPAPPLGPQGGDRPVASPWPAGQPGDRERRGQAARLHGRVGERGPNPALTGQSVAAFHRRPLKDISRGLVLDGVVLRRTTGAGALARLVLVALGLRPDGKRELIDFRLAAAESTAQWAQFLGDLARRGLTGERVEMLCVDGGAGLLAARYPRPSPGFRLQRCWAHKIRNLLNQVRKADLHRIINAPTCRAPVPPPGASQIAGRSSYPKAVACPRAALGDLLTCFRYPTVEQRKAVRPQLTTAPPTAGNRG